jgi:hypothetical protein
MAGEVVLSMLPKNTVVVIKGLQDEQKISPGFKIEVQHLIKQTNLHKKVMKTYSC